MSCCIDVHTTYHPVVWLYHQPYNWVLPPCIPSPGYSPSRMLGTPPWVWVVLPLSTLAPAAEGEILLAVFRGVRSYSVEPGRKSPELHTATPAQMLKDREFPALKKNPSENSGPSSSCFTSEAISRTPRQPCLRVGECCLSKAVPPSF